MHYLINNNFQVNMSFQKNITPFIKHIYSKLLTSFSFLTLGMHVRMFVGECMGGWVHVRFS